MLKKGKGLKVDIFIRLIGEMIADGFFRFGQKKKCSNSGGKLRLPQLWRTDLSNQVL